jgi:Protein tyrosine and serine/threonine kinase/Kelch motif/Galactose oxidase, central domain
MSVALTPKVGKRRKVMENSSVHVKGEKCCDASEWGGRWGHSALSHGTNEILVFGGQSQKAYNDVWRYKLREKRWEMVSTKGAAPTPRLCHAAVISDDQKMLVWGGRRSGKAFNDLHVLDLKSWKWSKVAAQRRWPGAVSGHSATLIRGRIVVFGGHTARQKYQNDVHVLDPSTLTWATPPMSGKVPRPRSDHAAVAVGRLLYIFGGFDGKTYYGDVHALDTRTWEWVDLGAVHGASPKPVASQAAALLGNRYVLLSGGEVNGTVSSDFDVFDVQANQWLAVRWASSQPNPRFHHACVVNKSGHVIIVGGSASGTLLADVWRVDVDVVVDGSGRQLLSSDSSDDDSAMPPADKRGRRRAAASSPSSSSAASSASALSPDDQRASDSDSDDNPMAPAPKHRSRSPKRRSRSPTRRSKKGKGSHRGHRHRMSPVEKSPSSDGDLSIAGSGGLGVQDSADLMKNYLTSIQALDEERSRRRAVEDTASSLRASLDKEQARQRHSKDKLSKLRATNKQLEADLKAARRQCQLAEASLAASDAQVRALKKSSTKAKHKNAAASDAYVYEELIELSVVELDTLVQRHEENIRLAQSAKKSVRRRVAQALIDKATRVDKQALRARAQREAALLDSIRPGVSLPSMLADYWPERTSSAAAAASSSSSSSPPSAMPSPRALPSDDAHGSEQRRHFSRRFTLSSSKTPIDRDALVQQFALVQQALVHLVDDVELAWQGGVVCRLGAARALVHVLTAPLTAVRFDVVSTVRADAVETLRIVDAMLEQFLTRFADVVLQRDLALLPSMVPASRHALCWSTVADADDAPVLVPYEDVFVALAEDCERIVYAPATKTVRNKAADKEGDDKEGSDQEIELALDELACDLMLPPQKSIVYEKELVIGRQIGKGGYGLIYEGNWKGRKVAVKIFQIKSPMLMDWDEPAERKRKELKRRQALASAWRQFSREMFSLLRCCEHPHLLPVLGYCLKPLCIVTHLCEGGDLYRMLSNVYLTKTFEFGEKLQVAKQIAEAMRHLHSMRRAPLLHNDLKTPNVFLEYEGKRDHEHVAIMLGDLGVASLCMEPCLGRLDEVTNPTWLAPEILKGAPHSFAADVYAFGLVLHELLTRRHPFSEFGGYDSRRVTDLIVSGKRPSFPDDTPMSFGQLIQDCWHSEARKRPTFNVIVIRLDQIINDHEQGDIDIPLIGIKHQLATK